MHINKHNFRTAQHEGIGGGDKGVARHDHFVARLDIQQDGRHLQRCGTGWRQQNFGATEALFHPLLAATGKTAIAAQLAAAHRGLHVIEFSTHDWWGVKWDHGVTCIASTRC